LFAPCSHVSPIKSIPVIVENSMRYIITLVHKVLMCTLIFNIDMEAIDPTYATFVVHLAQCFDVYPGIQ
jgi:hypothetical protein